jgi:hypothetical protein
MRLRAPAIGGGAAVLAVALVWYFRPGGEPPGVDGGAATVQTVPAARLSDPELATSPPSPEVAPVADNRVRPTATVERAPLPGETPSTPLANLFADRQIAELPPGLAEGEREFAAEPVDAAWAPGAEADLLATYAQMPGLRLIDLQVECRSTMCRVQLTQPRGATAADGGPRPFSILLDSAGLKPRYMNMISDPSGHMKSVAYLWREGFAPPKPEFGRPREAN